MATYTDTDRLELLLREYMQNEDPDQMETFISELVTMAENWVYRYLKDKIPEYITPGTIPDAMIDASTKRAAGEGLLILNSNDERTSTNVTEWFKDATDTLDRYVRDILEDEDEIESNSHVGVSWSVKF